MKNSKKNTMEIKKNNSKCTNFTMKNLNKTSNLKLGLQYSSIVGVIIQVTANFALALRSKPITSDLGKTIWLSEFLVAGSRCQDIILQDFILKY